VIHIAIISHGHEELLIQTDICGLVSAEADSTALVKIWIKDNKPNERLKSYCERKKISYTDVQPGLGFGDNNNFVFQQLQRETGFAAGDTFIAMNPDINTDVATVIEIAKRMHADDAPIATLNLYRDEKCTQFDGNIRPFPNWLSAPRMAIGKAVAPPYDKAAIAGSTQVDWASGAFLAFDAAHYARLNGFDTAYFMYFEDVDICYRSQLLTGKTVRYYPDLKATHIAAHKNRNFLSPHAAWFFQSFFKFLYRRYISYRFGLKHAARPL
jgi:N-acetylglucosaminyl-diphospho-decaprenol L-rhamnosyltransferase